MEQTETIFTWGAPPITFGAGAVDELWFQLQRFGDMARVMIVTDPGVAATGIPDRIRTQLADHGIDARVFDRVHVEPTDASMQEAIDAASGTDWDAFVAVGGGSSMDTAKAMNLITSYPGDLMDYVNAPIGGGRTPPGPLAPLVAVPTTAGTGSEATSVCVLDILSMKVKTGISHWRLQPSLAVIDPLTTLSLPPMVTASCGMDVVCHALESYTARPFHAYPHKAPEQRVTYCGSNPIADVWCRRALELAGSALRRAVLNGDHLAARTDMMQAATFAGLGFGNAGVHLPHACAYPIAGQVRSYSPPGYPDGPLVPHGMAVCMTAPASFRFTYPTDPDRHVEAARLLAPDHGSPADDAREMLPAALADLMRDIGMPNGLGALGYDEHDVDELVEGAMKQERLLVIAPRDVAAEDVAGIMRRSLHNW